MLSPTEKSELERSLAVIRGFLQPMQVVLTQMTQLQALTTSIEELKKEKYALVIKAKEVEDRSEAALLTDDVHQLPTEALLLLVQNLRKRLKIAEEKVVRMGWELNPDRMGH